MFKTILVPLDGSPLAESALPYAEKIGKTSGAKVVLTRVAMAETALGGNPVADQVRANEESQAYLDGAAARLRQAYGMVETAAPYGDSAEMILEEIKLRSADLVIMATHGRSGLGRMLFGSVTDRVLQHSPVPMLLVPASTGEFLPPGRQVRILVALDGSPRSEEVLEPAVSLAEALGAGLSLLISVRAMAAASNPHALRDALLMLEPNEAPERRDGAEGHLERLAGELRGRGLSVQVNAVTGDAATVIVQEAKAQDIALIAMATHGRGGLARLVMGSVTSEVLRAAGRPLLVVRPKNFAPVPTPEPKGTMVI